MKLTVGVVSYIEALDPTAAYLDVRLIKELMRKVILFDKPIIVYDDSLYDDNCKKSKTNEVISIAEVMNFAIKLGLDKAKIKPY